jgi:AraC-like DNA-binding protein
LEFTEVFDGLLIPLIAFQKKFIFIIKLKPNMPFEILNALVIIVMFGGLLLLAVIKLVNPLGINRRGNFFFGWLLLLWASFWVEEIALLAGVVDLPELFIRAVQCLQIWSPLFLFLSIRFYINPTDVFVWKDVRHLLIPAVFLLVIGFQLVVPGLRPVLLPVQVVLMFFQVFLYVTLSYILVKRHRKNLLRFESSIQGKDLNWLDYILLQVIIISFIALVSNAMGIEAPGVLMNSINLLVVFMVAYNAIGQKEIFPVQQGLEAQLDEMDEMEKSDKTEDREAKRKLLSEEELDLLKGGLADLMAAERPFLDSELNLVKLAEMLHVTPHKLSYTINTGYQLNFFQFVNQYRVEKAKELLLNNTKNFTVLAIAYESGFNSKTAFNTTFKKLCGQTPTEFAKEHAS